MIGSVKGYPNVMRAPNLKLSQLLPNPVGELDVNRCPDPDCLNFGERAFGVPLPLLGGGTTSKATLLNSTAAGLGKYRLSKLGGDYTRVSRVFEYQFNHLTWTDGRELRCQAYGDRGICNSAFAILSNIHMADEIERLRGHNGVLAGPACSACGRRYLDAPHEFMLNGANSKRPARKGAQTAGAKGIRVVHRPCRGKKGARFTISLDHVRQRNTADNVQILQALVNGVGINGIARMLSPSGSGRSAGIGRVYDRIFWLEATLLAFEREKLRCWREEIAARGEPARHHIAHDDVLLTVNWETSADRRLTQLNCAISADVRSGYVYRIDVDFDPTLDAASFFADAYTDQAGRPVRLRQAYFQKALGSFTHPLMSFQRPSGRLDEPSFFAAAASQLQVFRDTKLVRMPTATPEQVLERDAALARIDAQISLIHRIHEGYFDLAKSKRDRRAPFTGVPTRDIYTKAAHFYCLKEMLPPGWITLVTEQEGTLPRVLPHVFHDEIAADDFEWLVMTFDKDATKPEIVDRVKTYRDALTAFADAEQKAGRYDPDTMKFGPVRRAFIAQTMTTRTRPGAAGPLPYPSSNYQQGFMPRIWIDSPIQASGETEKVVGFPLVRSDMRAKLKALPFDQPIADPELRLRVARCVERATLQAVSTFINALRERISMVRRAGGRSAAALSTSRSCSARPAR